MAGLYFHIPYCKQACYYCDFHFSTNLESKEELVKAMLKELHLQQYFLAGEQIDTIYFGGGTPSLLDEGEISSILQTANQLLSINPGAEITLEANPDDLVKSKLNSLKSYGINRLSIGIQSFQNDLLHFLNRAHNHELAIRSYELAREAGFNNISIDLMFAIPGLTDSLWLKDIHQATALNPEHISCYSLTIEEKTVFGKWAVSGKLSLVDDEVAARQFEILMDELESAHYEHYEISNFAKSGFYSKHNTSYWQQTKYLGIGPGAHSYNGELRQFNIRNNYQYIQSLQQGEVPATIETLTLENKINEFLLTTLRTRWGTNLEILKQRHHYDLAQKNSDYIHQLLENQLAVLDNNILTLTRRGKLVADKIASDLFVL